LEAPFDWAAPPEKEIASYHQAYDAWIESARGLLQGLPDALSTTERTVQAAFTMTNTGVEPAQGLLVSFHASEGLLIHFPDDRGEDQNDTAEPPSDAASSRPTLRSPPRPPAWKKVYPKPTQPPRSYVDMSKIGGPADGSHLDRYRTAAGLGAFGASHLAAARAAMPGYSGLLSDYERLTGASALAQIEQERISFVPPSVSFPDLRPRPRDPEAFYFKSGMKGGVAAFISFECAEFRHRGAPEDFDFEIWFDKDTTVNGGQVEVQVHARNLREPVRHKVAVIRIIEKGDTLAEARIALGLG
jgi:hypothetical protein